MSEMKEIKAGRVRWPKGIGVEDTTEDIDNYITYKITEYTHYDVQDEELWEVFQEDFTGFSKSIFKDCNQMSIRKLRALLRMYGVWVKKDRHLTVAESLYNTLQEEDPTLWTIQEIEEHIRTIGQFNSARINYMLSQDNKVAGSTWAKTAKHAREYARQYIADYEGTDNDDTDDLDSIDEAIEALIVTDADTDQTNSEPVEHFTTSFGVLEPQRAFDITTTLANQSLTHALTRKGAASDPTAATTDSTDPFIYTTTPS
jgi:hypothetical protein